MEQQASPGAMGWLQAKGGDHEGGADGDLCWGPNLCHLKLTWAKPGGADSKVPPRIGFREQNNGNHCHIIDRAAVPPWG